MLFHLSRLIAHEEYAEGWTVVHQHAPIAVQHAAAGRNHGNVTDAIALGHRAVLVGVDDLELPEAQQQHADHSHDDVGSHGQPRLRQTIVVAEPVGHEDPAREYSYLRALRPARPNLNKLAGLNSRHEKIHSVGFGLTRRPRLGDPAGITPKKSVENFLEPGNRKNLPERPNHRRTQAAGSR